MEQALKLLSYGPDGWGDEILSGVLVTIGLAIATLPIGLALGFLLALAKRSEEKSLRMAADIYTTIFRGLPELLTLFIVYYGGQIAIRNILSLIWDNPQFEVNSFFAGMIALAVVFSSYASEAFLSAFRGISQGQYEGAWALGISRFTTMYRVILPQLIKLALPALSNLWLILLKDTALVSVIGLSDIMRQTSIAARVTKDAFLFFSFACLIYLVLAILSSIVLNRIESWSKKGEAR